MNSNHSLVVPITKVTILFQFKQLITQKEKKFLEITSYNLVGTFDGVGLQGFFTRLCFRHG